MVLEGGMGPPTFHFGNRRSHVIDPGYSLSIEQLKHIGLLHLCHGNIASCRNDKIFKLQCEEFLFKTRYIHFLEHEFFDIKANRNTIYTGPICMKFRRLLKQTLLDAVMLLN